MSNKLNNANISHQANVTEAWNDAQSIDPSTGVIVPTEDAVELSKEWVDENEK